MEPYFTFTKADDHYSYKTRGYGQGMIQISMATHRIKQRYAGSEKRILIVGHYHAGSRIIEILQGLEPVGRYNIANTQIIHLQEGKTGKFFLISD
jgi:hypothetical protein